MTEIRREAKSFLEAGDEAIRKTLSGNSTGFNTSNQQRGGQ